MTTSHGKVDDQHDTDDTCRKQQNVAQKKDHGIKRLPTIFVRNKKPRKNIFEQVIDVSLLGLPRHDSAEAAYLHHFSSHLKQAYIDACGRREKLTRAAFEDFLMRIQGEEAVAPLAKEEYTYEEFLEHWTVKYGLGALRGLTQDQRDCSKPISNYFISSSHNTYLEGHQIYSESSSKIYQKVRAFSHPHNTSSAIQLMTVAMYRFSNGTVGVSKSMYGTVTSQSRARRPGDPNRLTQRTKGTTRRRHYPHQRG